MWIIRQEQLNHLNQSFDERVLAERIHSIRMRIEETHPEITTLHSAIENAAIIRETVMAALSKGILVLEDQLDWSLHRLATGRNFWEGARLHSLLDDNLIHPRAKARYALLLSPVTADPSTKGQ
jgi:hypothetical protein